MQYDLMGNLTSPQGMNAQQRVRYVMETWPETAGNDGLLMARYAQMYGGLVEALERIWASPSVDEAVEHLAPVLDRLARVGVTRRRREIQYDRGKCLPDDATLKRRQDRDGKGPVR